MRAGGEGDDRGWDGWMASLTQWRWVWVDSSSWWWIGRPGVLQFTGSQRVRHDWATELDWTDGHNIPGSYAILFFTATDFTSITSHIHSWVFFSFGLCLFILSGFISPLFSSSILGTYWPGEFIFQHHIFLPFHTIHGVLKARIPNWFALSVPSPVDHILVFMTQIFTLLKDLWDPDNHNGMITHLAPDILGCKVKWA